MRPPFRSGGVVPTFHLDNAWWRVRRRLRSPALYWAVAAAVGLITTAGVARLVSQAEAGAARYGQPVTVVKASTDLPAGHLVTEGDVSTVELPDDAVPPDAVGLDPVGQRLAHPVGADEVLASRHLVDGAVSALAAQVPADRHAVSIPLAASGLEVEPGDVVDVWGLDPDTFAYTPAARRAAVMRSEDSAVVVAVERDELGAVLAAVADGSASFTLYGIDDG